MLEGSIKTLLPGPSMTSASMNSCKLNPPKSMSSTNWVGLSKPLSPSCMSISLLSGCNGRPTMSARALRGSSRSIGGVISCLKVEPLVRRDVVASEVVELFSFDVEDKDEDRGL